jgi:hypothetical protein
MGIAHLLSFFGIKTTNDWIWIAIAVVGGLIGPVGMFLQTDRLYRHYYGESYRPFRISLEEYGRRN